MANQVTLRSLLQTVGLTGTQLYVTRPVTYNTIGETDFIERVHNDSGLPTPALRVVFNSLLTIMKEELLNGHGIQLGSIGTFALSARIRACESPKDISAKNVKRLRVRIFPDPSMKAAMKSTKFVMGQTSDGRGYIPVKPTDNQEEGD